MRRSAHRRCILLLKVLYPTSSGIAGAHSDAFPWSGTTFAVGLELLLGWGLVAGVGPKYLRPASGILFTLFAVYSMHGGVARIQAMRVL